MNAIKPGKLVLASGNAHKLREFRGLFEPLGFSLVSQAELGIHEADEPFCTFVENALAKARHVARESNLPALADDSGVCVHALGGAPGVNSAYYAGPAKVDAANNAKLIRDLAGHADRSAHYTAVLVYLRHADDPEPIIAEGRWYGQIIDTPRGTGGFGYDPHFWVPEHQCTAAELSLEQKNALSHRSKALVELLAKLRA